MTLQVKSFLTTITVCVLLSLIIGCSPPMNIDGDTTQAVSVTPSKAYPSYPTEMESNTATVPVTPTVTDDHSAAVIAPTATAMVTATSTPPPEPMPTQEPEMPGGTLFIRSFDEGLLRVSLETGEVESLVPKEEDWLVWGFAVAPDQERIAYWIQTAEKSELWVSNLIEWSPELVLSFSDLEHDTFILWWVSNDHLLFEPSIIDQRYNDFFPVRAYIINMRQRQVEVEDTGFAFGCLLAPSPETGELATWCPAKENWTDIQSYYTASISYYVVIEEAGFLWTTTEPPLEVVTRLRTHNDMWVWSHNRNLVAFRLYDAEKGSASLHFVEQSTLASFLIDQQDVRYYFALDWSPDGQYIAYSGTCGAYGCKLITDLASREVIWTSRMVPGLRDGTNLAWSYDSRYVALQFEGITIVNVQTNEIIQKLDIPSTSVLVWLP